MTWDDPRDKVLSAAYLRWIEEDPDWLERIRDIEGDDTDGRVTGKYRCGFCGMTSHDPEHPQRCCLPAFEAAGII